MPQLTVFITITVAPTSIPAFTDAHRPVWKACAQEPECLFFDVFQDQSVPGRFRFVEVWSKSKEWFEREQMSKPYYADMWTKSKPLWLEDPKVEYFETLGEGDAIRREGYIGNVKSMD